MSVQLPPNSTGQVIDTVTTVAGLERQCTQRPVGGQFAITHAPVAATQATITKAAGAPGVKNVATLVSFSLCTVGTAQAAAVTVVLRDGATGAGTILWSMTISCGTTTAVCHSVSLPDIQGSAATAMTLEFSAAGVAASFESVSLAGYTTA